ncbi:MAG: DUF192 domain-containing protein [Alphaproteobacteria bacterium]|nr:DUF192 domain-containing protein [Alphaproteobacteria bacterium]
MKNYRLVIAFLAFLSFAAAVGGSVVQAETASSFIGTLLPGSDEFEEDQLAIRTNDGERYYFNVELAVTSAQQSHGMMERTRMDDDAGMLFIFHGEGMRAFWMKDTLIPLDMLFLSEDGTIHHIHHNAKPQDETTITSRFPSKAVLELKGGMTDKLGIKEGDVVEHDVFRNVGIAE